MALSKINPTTTPAWQKLEEHYKNIKDVKMKDLFANNADRAHNMSVIWNDFYLDYSKNRITPDTLKYLLELADEVKLKEAIDKQFSWCLKHLLLKKHYLMPTL